MYRDWNSSYCGARLHLLCNLLNLYTFQTSTSHNTRCTYRKSCDGHNTHKLKFSTPVVTCFKRNRANWAINLNIWRLKNMLLTNGINCFMGNANSIRDIFKTFCVQGDVFLSSKAQNEHNVYIVKPIADWSDCD